MKIGHAVCDELGRSSGGVPGDQTGKEIRIQDWYDRPWDTVIVPKSDLMGRAAADFCERICNSSLYGYNQKRRTDGHKAIVRAGFDIEHSDGGDFDCSSLVSACYIYAGSKVGICYTGSLEKVFRKSGEFNIFKDDEHLHNPELAKKGSLYLATGHHVCMLLEDGSELDPRDYVLTKGSVRLRACPVDGKTIAIVRNACLPYIGTDEETGWYIVEHNGAPAYVTANARYTEVVRR